MRFIQPVKLSGAARPAARVMLAILAAGMLVMLCGCWDNAEINGRAFVLGFGADRGERSGAYDFTFQLAVPVSGESEDSGAIQYVVCTVTEDSPAAAVRILEKNIGRQINFEQLNAILVGEELARENFLELTEYFFRRASVRRQSSVAVCGGRAEDFLSMKSTGSAIASDAAVALQSYDDKGGADSVTMNLYALFKTLSNGDEFYLLKILAVASDAMGPSGQSKPSPDEGEQSMLCIDGAMAYGRDGGFRGSLDDRELELLRLLSGRQVSGLTAAGNGISGGQAYYRIRQSRCETVCGVKEGVPAFTLRLEVMCEPTDIGDWYGGTREESLRAQREVERTLTAEMNSLAERSRRELGASVLGFQDALRQHMPEWYEKHAGEWEKLYGAADIRVEMRCVINDGGVTK